MKTFIFDKLAILLNYYHKMLFGWFKMKFEPNKYHLENNLKLHYIQNK